MICSRFRAGLVSVSSRHLGQAHAFGVQSAAPYSQPRLVGGTGSAAVSGGRKVVQNQAVESVFVRRKCGILRVRGGFPRVSARSRIDVTGVPHEARERRLLACIVMIDARGWGRRAPRAHSLAMPGLTLFVREFAPGS